ncbi:hypothetical protein FB451DRAFT_743387 [Mycena latifolia]|nr:hypothetical protein FB451DRAFT_743387 [Mycena latifolia]
MAQATTSPPSCLICKGGKSDVGNYLLTCVDCGRSWHHQCHQPPIPQQEMEALLRSYLASSRQLRLPWRCRKCMRKKATVGQQPNSSESGIPVGYPQEPTVPRPYPPESWPNRPTAGPEVIDLTESPAAPRLRRRVPTLEPRQLKLSTSLNHLLFQRLYPLPASLTYPILRNCNQPSCSRPALPPIFQRFPVSIFLPWMSMPMGFLRLFTSVPA